HLPRAGRARPESARARDPLRPCRSSAPSLRASRVGGDRVRLWVLRSGPSQSRVPGACGFAADGPRRGPARLRRHRRLTRQFRSRHRKPTLVGSQQSTRKELAMANPTVFPTLVYADAVGAIDFLVSAFGAERHAVYSTEETVQHAELRLGNGMVMIGPARPDADATCGAGAGIYVVVDDP